MEIETQEELEKYIFDKMSELFLTHRVMTKEESDAALEKAYLFMGELLYQRVNPKKCGCYTTPLPVGWKPGMHTNSIYFPCDNHKNGSHSHHL